MLGAGGIIGPYLETVEQLKGLVGAVKWRPLKGRKLAAALENPATLEPELREYLEKRNGDKILIAQIESEDGWVALGEVGKGLTNLAPDFDSRTFGFRKLSDLVRKTNSFEIDQPKGGSMRIRIKSAGGSPPKTRTTRKPAG